MWTSRISTSRRKYSGISAFSPIQFGVVLPLPLLLVAQLQALECLHVVHVLQSFPVVFYYVSRERFHILLGAMERGERGRRDPAGRGIDKDDWRRGRTTAKRWEDGRFRDVSGARCEAWRKSAGEKWDITPNRLKQVNVVENIWTFKKNFRKKAQSRADSHQKSVLVCFLQSGPKHNLSFDNKPTVCKDQ